MRYAILVLMMGMVAARAPAEAPPAPADTAPAEAPATASAAPALADAPSAVAEEADAPALTADGIPLADVHRVFAGENEEVRYYCYVPKAYDPARRWPVVYGFSPGDRAGRNSAKRWAPVAEKYGWIVAWCDEACTGRFSPEDLKDRFDALMASVQGRLSVHPTRSCATGFSAGARWAVAMACMYPDRFSGVIPVGGFFPPTRGEHPKNVYVYAIAGKDDPNLRELNMAKDMLTEQGVPFVLETFDGGHAIAPARLLDEGVRWLTRQYFIHHDDPSPEGRAERLAAAREMAKEIQDLLKTPDERSEAYERAREFRETFGDSTHAPLEALVAKNDALITALEKDPSVAGMAGYTAPDPDQIIAAFLKALEGLPVDAAARAAARGAVEAARGDPGRRYDALVDGLSRVYPAFAAAVAALQNEDTVAAIGALEKMVDSPDPYLAAHAAYFMGRAYIMEEKYEDAMPLLAKTAGEWNDRTLYSGDSLFLVGICQGRLLHRKAALRILTDFLTHYPDAPERMLVGADHVARTIEAIQDGSLGDVQERMDDSRRRLKLERSGKPTQIRQDRIVAMLDKLIEEAEQREQSGSGGGGGGGGGGGQGGSSGPPSGNQQPGAPANSSSAPAGQSRIGALDRAHRGNPEDSWGAARQRERERILNVLKDKFPERYRDLLEQYYKSLQEGEP